MGVDAGANHGLKKELRLRDLVPMQILLVVGVTWCGLAAREGGSHLWFWIGGIVLLFVPLALVVTYCVRLWPQEGGVYQWTKHAIGPWAGFLSAWNFGVWALLVLSNLGILTATSLSYALGDKYAWMATDNIFIMAISVGLFLIILLVSLPGFGIGKWVSHFGTALTLLVTFLLMVLLVVHPHASAAHPHVNPQKPFSLAFPTMTLGWLLMINLFTKMTFNALSGLEQVAVFAGETRDAAKTILRSAWIAAPVIAVIYILMTGSLLTYIPAGNVDLTGPIPQVLAAAFSGGGGTGTDWGLMLGRATILTLAVACVAQYAVVVAELSRLPMVAGWDGMLPKWFTELHPKWKTPTHSIMVIVGLAIASCGLALIGTSNQEAFQLIVTVANLCGGVYYLLMFLVPLVTGDRFGPRPGLLLKLCSVSGLLVTLAAMAFMMVPIVDVKNPWVFGAKVLLSGVVANVVALVIYWNGTQRAVNRE